MMKIFALLLSISLFFSVMGCVGKNNPWLNSDEYDTVAQKLKSTQRAVIRYQQAEDAALRDGDEEGAAAYRTARESLLAELPEIEDRYKTLEAEKLERLKNQQDNFKNRQE